MISDLGLQGVRRVFRVLFICLPLVPCFRCCFGLLVGRSSVMILCYCLIFSGMRLNVTLPVSSILYVLLWFSWSLRWIVQVGSGVIQ